MPYKMTLRPPTLPRPSFEMNQIPRAIEMMASAIRQQNMTVAHNHQAFLNHWETTKTTATTPFVIHA